MEHLKMHTINKVDENVSKIAALFPNCVTEAKGENGEITHKIDFDMLKQELSNTLVEGREERYQFTWPDKRQAILTANAPINKTLRPCRKESVNFDETENLYIEGDNLEVLKLLQETYLGKIKMIYIDPPYNTGNDFVYNDEFSVSSSEFSERSGNFDEEGNLLVDNYTRNTESNGRFHTDWLNMMYPRLKLARDLLSDDGVIFISIDDNEVENLKKVCDEIFGESNFVAEFVIASNSAKNNSKFVSVTHEYLLCIAKNKDMTPINWKVKKTNSESFISITKKLISDKLSNEEIHSELLALVKYPKYYEFDHYTYVDKRGPFRASDLTAPGSKNKYDLLHPITKKPCKVGIRGWAYSEKEMDNLIKNDLLLFGRDETVIPQLKNYLFENETSLPKSVLFFDSQSSTKWIKSENFGFDFPKAIEYIKFIVSMYPRDNNFTVLDFFSGSATTAHAVMQLNAEDGGNRKFIMVQLPEPCDEKSEAYKAGYKNICEIGKERIRRAGQQILKTCQKDKEKSHGLDFANAKSDENLLFNETPLGVSNPCDNIGGVAGVSPAEGVAENAQAVGARGRLPPSGNYKLDIGFRVLKCDTSNMEDVYYTPDHLDKQDLFKNNIKSDRTAEDLLFQVMLDLGIMLSSKIQTKQIDGKTVYYVEGNYLVACFDEDVTEETITKIAKEKPYNFVMRDPANSKDGDSLITNFEQIFTTYSPETVRKIL